MNWKVPKIWEDGTCFIIGGGPSVISQFNIPERIVNAVRSKTASIVTFAPHMKVLHNKHVIGINGSFRLGNWVDMCFFGDKAWYFENRSDLLLYNGLVVSCAEFLTVPGWQKENIKYLEKETKPYGISTNSSKVCWNYNSGAAAISLAVHTGCKRIILLGFDMQLTNGVGHWHNLYNGKTSMPFAKHLVGFDTIAEDAKRMGVEIINANPDSKITQFPKMNFKEIKL